MKNFILTILFIVICQSAFGELLQTKTMDSTLFSDLKDACADSLTGGDGTDEVMTFYYNKLKLTRDEGEEDFREFRSSFEPINQVGYYAKLSILGAIGRGLEQPNTWEQLLIRAKNMLLDDPFYDGQHPDPAMWTVNMYLDLDSVWVEYEDGTFGDCLNYGRLLLNVAFTVDMLWYYVNDSERDSLYDKLAELAGWANELLSETNFDGGYAQCTNSDYPPQLWTSYHNGRI
ncbi:MAG: hypothetical protein H8E11_08130 [Candidatus Cloacimonetes bacterium]|nr:hypothetical protein [Candidatus Cloacimonadota bacterium]